MNYVFYFKEEKGIEHISCTCYDDESGTETYDKIGNTEKLIEYINRHCLPFSEVYFVDFKENKIMYILNNISEDIEVNYPPIGYDGPYQMLKRISKVRGK